MERPTPLTGARSSSLMQLTRCSGASGFGGCGAPQAATDTTADASAAACDALALRALLPTDSPYLHPRRVPRLGGADGVWTAASRRLSSEVTASRSRATVGLMVFSREASLESLPSMVGRRGCQPPDLNQSFSLAQVVYLRQFWMVQACSKLHCRESLSRSRIAMSTGLRRQGEERARARGISRHGQRNRGMEGARAGSPVTHAGNPEARLGGERREGIGGSEIPDNPSTTAI